MLDFFDFFHQGLSEEYKKIELYLIYDLTLISFIPFNGIITTTQLPQLNLFHSLDDFSSVTFSYWSCIR